MDTATYVASALGIPLGWFAFHSGRSIAGHAHVLFDMPEQDSADPSQDRDRNSLATLPRDRSYWIGAIGYGLAFSAIPFLFGDALQTSIVWLICMSLVWTALFDWRHSVVPDLYVAVIGVLSVPKVIVLGHDPWSHLLAGVFSGALMSGLLVGSALFRARRTGTQFRPKDLAWGDVTLISGLGLNIGLWGLPVFWFLSGLFHILAHMVTDRGRQARLLGEPVPMAPSMCLATFCTMIALDSPTGRRMIGYMIFALS